MEDYRRQELMPLGTVNRGYESFGGDIDDRSRADRLREEFLERAASKGGTKNPNHIEARREALNRALLSQEQVRGNQSLVCGFSPEARRQVFFTCVTPTHQQDHTL